MNLKNRIAKPTTVIRAGGRRVSAVMLLACLISAWPGPARAAVSEVVFRVSTNASIDWFKIDDPSVHGTLNVTNAPYASNSSLNAAAVDVSRNRLIFDSVTGTVQGYAISLSGLQLIQNAATPVLVTALGTWNSGGDTAGYRKSDGQVYFYPLSSDQLNKLNFGATGLITGITTVGRFNGTTAPNIITGGDIDFAADGSIWLSGKDDTSVPRLWNFDSTTLNSTATYSTTDLYNGITFNAAGTTLYGYRLATSQYGTINLTTGEFQTVLTTDPVRFGAVGDLATGTAVIVVPEPTSCGILAALFFTTLAKRRRFYR